MDDYAYVNARVRAMQGRLLARERYETLLAQETVEDIARTLDGSAYEEALERATEAPETRARHDPAVRFDEALRRELTGTLAKLRRLTTDRTRELLDALLLRWDAYNVKTILRGKRASASVDEILTAMLPAGTLDEIALAELSRAPTASAIADTLATWRMPLARPLREGLHRLGEAQSLQAVEFELDRFVCLHALAVAADDSDDDAAVRSYVRLWVDRTNLVTASRYLEERSALSPCEAARHFIEAGGLLTRSQFEAVVGGRDLRDGLARLAGGPFHWLATWATQCQLLAPQALERQLDRVLLGGTLRLARRNPLGIGVCLAYVERKINEVRNLRMIVRGKLLGMEAERIAEWLIVS